MPLPTVPRENIELEEEARTEAERPLHSDRRLKDRHVNFFRLVFIVSSLTGKLMSIMGGPNKGSYPIIPNQEPMCWR